MFAQILSPNQHLEREPTGKNHATIGVAHSAGFNHKLHVVVLNLVRDMAIVYAFSMCIGLVRIKPLTRVIIQIKEQI